MRLVEQGRGFWVYDDVLDPEAFQALWVFMQKVSYTWIHSQGWMKAWRLTDGTPLHGPICYSNNDVGAVLNGQRWKPEQSPVYPTGAPIDHLFGALQEKAPDWADLIGEEGKDWVGFTAKPFLYPQGTCLSWHEDSIRYTGAFTYYAHPRWNVKWGGELLVTGDAGEDRHSESGRIYEWQGQPTGQHLDNTKENEKLLDYGIGSYVMAKPNRLVIVQTGIAHAITPVTPAAGDNVRASISGFFTAVPDAKAQGGGVRTAGAQAG